MIAVLLLSLCLQEGSGRVVEGSNSAGYATLRGFVLDERSGQGLAGATVTTLAPDEQGKRRPLEVGTDRNGQFRFRDLPPGEYQFTARSSLPFGGFAERRITLKKSDSIDNFYIRITLNSTIRGRVIDGEGRPVAAATVWQIVRERSLGGVRHFYRSLTQTDLSGEFALEGYVAGSDVLLLAERRILRFPLTSKKEGNEKPPKRKPILAPTFYPSSPTLTGASLVATTDEGAQAVTIVMNESDSFCISGQLPIAAPTEFTIQSAAMLMGYSSSGGLFVPAPKGISESDGSFNVCGLVPGDYRLQVELPSVTQARLGTQLFSVYDRNIDGIEVSWATAVAANVRVRVHESAKAILDAEGPTPGVEVRVTPFGRHPMQSEQQTVRTSPLGAGGFSALLVDEYALRVRLLSPLDPRLYVKSVRYAGEDLLVKAFRPGSGSATSDIEVEIAGDGGLISILTVDKDGKPAPFRYVYAFPADVTSEEALSASFIQLRTQEDGRCVTPTLARKEYAFIATDRMLTVSPSSIARLWGLRSGATKMTVATSGRSDIRVPTSEESR